MPLTSTQGPGLARPPPALDLPLHPDLGIWLNAVETFSALTRRRLRRGTFRSIVELQAAINRYLAEHNADPQPFVWTKPADQILAKLNRLNALCTRPYVRPLS
jgi:hypothetical protein